MAKDPAFLFYPGDVLQEISLMNNTQRGIYLSLICYLHKNISISHEQLMSFTAGTNEQDIKVIIASLAKDSDGNFHIEWLKKETERRKEYSLSRAKNRSGSGKKNRKSSSKKDTKTYVPHMETETEDENKDVIEKEKDARAEKIVMPFDDEIFLNAWQGWKEYKKSAHNFNYRGKHSEQIALKRLSELARGDLTEALKIIEQSIGNGWEGLFEIKTKMNGHNKTTIITESNRQADEIIKRGNPYART